jgi:hypothetical protein
MRSLVLYGNHAVLYEQRASRTWPHFKALLPSGVDSLNTALAQSFCAEKYRILSLWQSISKLFRWLALHFIALVRRLLSAARRYSIRK